LATETNPSLQLAEADVQAHSNVLRRELGIGDLILAQILIVIVPEFFGTAVKAGAAHVVLWLAAILLFFIPHALVVAHLNRLMPLEGGLYEWARLAFSDRIGFLVAWNMWLNTTAQVSQVALVTTTYISYAFPRAAWVASNPGLLVAASVALIAAMTVAGFFSGVIMPSRDMIVREITPPGSFGKVFGFVTNGFNIGGIVSPLIFGAIMDHGSPRLVFVSVTAFCLMAVLTVANRPRRFG